MATRGQRGKPVGQLSLPLEKQFVLGLTVWPAWQGDAQRTDLQQAESQMPQVRTLGRPSPLDFSVCSSTVMVAGLMGSPGSIRPQALPSGLSWLPTLGLEDGQPNCSVLRNTRQLTHNVTGI